ncbi:MAG: aldo/keto reductase [Opitutales bacterium]|nr:aldo/keto reductase [Opitutales bacterium]MCH8541431.1 aldo/keto reductase [Opitutales bacterium]
MIYNRLGSSGLQVSALSFGAWVTFGQQVGEDTAKACMKEAYDAGVNFFDNAEAYAGGEAERVMGRILADMNWPRESFVVSSKVFFGGDYRGINGKGLSRKHVFEACHAALKRLQVDYLDLFFCHRADPNTPIEETVRIMTDLIQQGKILYWGTSEWSAQEIMEAYAVARQYNLVPPTMEQPQYNLFTRQRVEKEYARLYKEIGLGTTIWSPLASGLLTGKYNDGLPQDSRANVKGLEWLRDKFTSEEAHRRIEGVKRLATIADELGTKLPRLALAWCLKNPNVSTVITGASKPEQVKDNMPAIELVPKLTDEVMEKIHEVVEPLAE